MESADESVLEILEDEASKPTKELIVIDDSDDEGPEVVSVMKNSEEIAIDKNDSESKQEMVKKTLGKTQKRKQNQTDERVNFQIPGKNTSNKNSVAKQGTSTPNKNDVPKKQATPAKTNLKEFKGLLASDSAEKNGRDRDSRILCIGDLPKDITPTELISLSDDIRKVTFPRKANKKRKFMYAFTEFVSETKAEENYKTLKSRKVRGQPITVNYVGHKRQNQEGDPLLDAQNRNRKVLRVPKLPRGTTINKVANMFPEAFQIQINKNKTFWSARIKFHTQELAAEGMTASKDFKINGLPVTVVYAKRRNQQIKKKRGKKQRTEKKVKLEVKQESEDYNRPQKIKLETKQESEDCNRPQKKIKLETKQEREDEE